MGFLLGAYGKLAAGSRMRSIQARMLRVSAKLRRITRQVQNMEKMISRQEKTLTNNITIESNLAKQMSKIMDMQPEKLDDLRKNAILSVQNQGEMSFIEKYIEIMQEILNL